MITLYLKATTISVNKAIENANFHDKFVAVHGIFYLGTESLSRDYALLPGSTSDIFDSEDDKSKILIEKLRNAILIDSIDLRDLIRRSGYVGTYDWCHDAVIIGRLKKSSQNNYQMMMTELMLLVMQTDMTHADGTPEPTLSFVMASPNTDNLILHHEEVSDTGECLLRIRTN